jgi:aminotransferase/cystathionine beta-lyase
LLLNPLVNEGGRYTINFDDLEAKASQKHAKLLLLCSPHNPVGRTWLRHELEQIADICLRHDVLILSDEIHFDIIFPPHRHTVFATLDQDLRDRCIICTSPSKTFNIAGMQISNIIIANRDLRKKFVKASHNCGFEHPNCLAYDACQAAYDHAEPWLDALLMYLNANDRVTRDCFAEHKLPVTISPLEATYLQWLDFTALGLDTRDLQQLMREKAGVFFEEGHIFGDEGRGFERLNLAYPRSVIEEVARRVEIAIDCMKTTMSPGGLKSDRRLC